MSKKELDSKIRLVRAERYACQAVARKALPGERVSMCLRFRNNSSEVQVWKHKKTAKAFYGGLVVCGSVWLCPICAAKISERRRIELQKAFVSVELLVVETGQVSLRRICYHTYRIIWL